MREILKFANRNSWNNVGLLVSHVDHLIINPLKECVRLALLGQTKTELLELEVDDRGSSGYVIVLQNADFRFHVGLRHSLTSIPRLR